MYQEKSPIRIMFPIPGASVIVMIDKASQGASTNSDGQYSLQDIPTGTYTIKVSSLGYGTITKQIEILNDLVQNFSLKDDLLALDGVVITGFSNPKTKLESSVAITTLKAKQIEEQAPRSTADLLQTIPGFMVETSGGQTGNNLFARGIPSAGAYEYVQFQEDGLPVFEDGALQFANIDNFQRTDLTVQNLEAVKGGSASIYASGAPGGIINFISKTGQNEFKGTTKLTVGDYGLLRTDFNAGGAIVQDKLFFNAGGFYRVDNGIRDPGYTANKGGQVKFNLTYKFDKGYARVHFKNLNDRTIFYQSTPFVKKGNSVEAYKGFDANYGTFAHREMARIRIPQGDGGYFTGNLQDGIHPKKTAIGGEFKYDLTDKITVKNSFKSTNIDQDYNAIFAASWMGAVTSQADYANPPDNYKTDVNGSFVDKNGNVLDEDGTPLDAKGDKIKGGDDARVVEQKISNPVYTYNQGGGKLPSDRNLKRADLWYIKKQMNNFANNLSFNIDLDKINLNLGHYYSNWTSHQHWNWSSFLTSVEDEGRLVNLTNTNGTTSTDDDVAHTSNGISGISWLQRESQIGATVNALFTDVEIEASENLNFNLGLRYDIQRYQGFGDHGTWGNNIGVIKNNKADNGVNILKGNYVHWDYDVDELSYTAAANYKINDNMAAYARYSRGFRAPIEEAFYVAVEGLKLKEETKEYKEDKTKYKDRAVYDEDKTLADGTEVKKGQWIVEKSEGAVVQKGSAALETLKPTVVNQIELGFKYSSPNLAVFANLFNMRLDNVTYQNIGAGGLSERKFANVTNTGIELEAIVKFGNFHTTFNGTFQKPEYTGYEGKNEKLNGNTARRISPFYFNIRPDYDITKDINVYVRYAYFGEKYNDIENKFTLPAFGVLNAGASYKINNFRFALDASNLLNTIGLTEGDGGAPEDGQTFLGRSILGRAVTLSMAVNF